MTRCRSGLAAAAAVLLLSAGCRSPQPRVVELDHGVAGMLRVVVAPLNLPIPLAPDLEDAVDSVTQEMIRYLQANDARVSVIFAPDAWALWRDFAAAVQKEGPDPPDVAAVASVFSR